MSKPRVLLLVAGDNGTIGSCSLNLYEGFKRYSEIEVKCAIVNHFDNGLEGFKGSSYFDKSKGKTLRNQIKWLREIKSDYKPDVTISTLFSVTTLNILSGGNDKKIGIFHSPHQQVKIKGWKNYILTILQYCLLYPKLDRLYCVSKEVYDSLSFFPWIGSKKKKIVYNIHNFDKIKILSEKSIPSNHTFIPLENPYILFCGRLDYNKALLRSLEAFALADKPFDANLIFLGEDQKDLVEVLRNKARQLGLSDHIFFLDRQNNPYPYFKKAKALISSSFSEGLPGVIIEALSLGKPVIATNSSKGIWEIFSCYNQFIPHLTGIYENEYGFISSNLAKYSKSSYQDDIKNLAECISKIWSKEEFKGTPFLEEVSEEKVINSMIKDFRHFL